eukprot:PLAT10803.3.p1 GENE.PLAT10803.3~~PLAT10803.3.p1  ORF type:complete len:360 (+),score=168.74 PLAT10803.3:145-1224(+)
MASLPGAAAAKQKVLLMGKSGCGKTSMRSIIFANYLARDTMRLAPTLNVEHSHVRFLGNLMLNLWDCGGQDAFYENYFESQRDHIFRNVKVLIYVFDIESRDVEKDMDYFRRCLEAVAQNSEGAKVFVLVHKMDLVPAASREEVVAEREAEIRAAVALTPELVDSLRCYWTSIWDETLYKAWSSIVYALIPNIDLIETHLRNFAKICEADEVVLFERATFLVVSHSTQKGHTDVHRFEKVSNIVKQFKLSCGKSSSQFQAMTVKNSAFTAFLDQFTTNTYIMVIMSDASIPSAVTSINIRATRGHFEKLIQQTAELPAASSDAPTKPTTTAPKAVEDEDGAAGGTAAGGGGGAAVGGLA